MSLYAMDNQKAKYIAWQSIVSDFRQLKNQLDGKLNIS